MIEKARYVDRLALDRPLRDLRYGLAALTLVQAAISNGIHTSDDEAADGLRFVIEALKAPLSSIADVARL